MAPTFCWTRSGRRAKELVHHVTGLACAFVGVEHSLKGFGGTLLLEPAFRRVGLSPMLAPKRFWKTITIRRFRDSEGALSICISQRNGGGGTLPLLLRM